MYDNILPSISRPLTADRTLALCIRNVMSFKVLASLPCPTAAAFDTPELVGP